MVDLALDWVPVFVFFAFAVCLFLLPLCLVRGARPLAAAGLVLASYVFGAGLWITSAIFTYNDWGWGGVLVGLFVLGIGVFPIAAFTMVWHQAWMWLLWLVFLFSLMMASRMAGMWIADSAAGRRVPTKFK